MANIAVGESDFSTLFEAANLAKDTGRIALAKQLDKLARKTNAALSFAKTNREIPSLPGRARHKQRWQDVPSTIDG